MTDQPKVVDVNHADLEELAAVPGMGPALAEKVIAGRPYAGLEELTRVRGIGSKSLRPMLPYLSVSGSQPQEAFVVPPPGGAISQENSIPALPVMEAQPPVEQVITLPPPPESGQESPVEYPQEEEYLMQEESDEPQQVEGIPVKAAEAPISEAAGAPPTYAITHVPETEASGSPLPSPAAAKPKSGSGGTTALAVGIGLLVLILGVVFSLGILRLINGTLSFASTSQVRALQTRLDDLNGQIGTLQQDVNGLRTRMDALDALSGRVSSVEKQAQAIQDNLQATQAEVAALQEQSKQMKDQITQLQERSNVFQRFLDGMRSLFANLFPGTPSQ